jgi:hypothetical protein
MLTTPWRSTTMRARAVVLAAAIGLAPQLSILGSLEKASVVS